LAASPQMRRQLIRLRNSSDLSWFEGLSLREAPR
jgi:hypothetical protein